MSVFITEDPAIFFGRHKPPPENIRYTTMNGKVQHVLILYDTRLPESTVFDLDFSMLETDFLDLYPGAVKVRRINGDDLGENSRYITSTGDTVVKTGEGVLSSVLISAQSAGVVLFKDGSTIIAGLNLLKDSNINLQLHRDFSTSLIVNISAGAVLQVSVGYI